ncbi:BES1/BZR1 protein 4 [Asimina triloba]
MVSYASDGKLRSIASLDLRTFDGSAGIAVTGCKPVERMDIVGGGSASASPCSSYHPSPCASYNPSPCASYNPSPCASYNPSPGSSSFPSPASSYAANLNADPNSLIPWLKNLSSASSSASSSKLPHHLYIHGGSISAPVTPPLSSPTARTPRMKTDWDDQRTAPFWAKHNYPFLPSSTPPSPGRQSLPDSRWLSGIQIPPGGPSSPTFSLVSANPFGFREEVLAGGVSRMWTPGQSGTCSPAVAGTPSRTDVHMSDGMSDEFAFGSNAIGLVKPWEGERIHEECGSDELELTLGSSHTRCSGSENAYVVAFLLVHRCLCRGAADRLQRETAFLFWEFAADRFPFLFWGVGWVDVLRSRRF